MPLWPRQQEALDLLVPAKRAIYGDAAGSGKTRVALSALDEWGSQRALILVPDLDLIMPQWPEEAAGWSDRLLVLGAGDAPRRGRAREKFTNTPGPAALVLNYEAAWRDVEALKRLGFDALVCDEAHHLKNRQTATFKGVRLLARRVPHLLLVTGTPILNSADEAWSMLHMIDPKRWSSYWNWTREHFLIEVTDFHGTIPRPVRLVEGLLPGHEEIVRGELAGVLVQRSFEELFPDVLPPVLHDIEVELTPEERRLYDELRRRSWTRIGEDVIQTVNTVSKYTRLRQFTSEWNTLSAQAGHVGAKVTATVDLVARQLQSEQVVILVAYKETAAQLAQQLGSSSVITGDVPRRERRPILDDFKAGHSRVLIGTVPVLAEGVDGLQVARHMVLHDRDWTPARNEQILARLRRGGQERQVHAWHMIARDTLDNEITDALHSKLNIVRSVL